LSTGGRRRRGSWRQLLEACQNRGARLHDLTDRSFDGDRIARED
jgi:hypothetical protein